MDQGKVYFEIINSQAGNIQLSYRTQNNNIYKFYIEIENIDKPINELIYWLYNFDTITLLQKEWNNTNKMKILYQDYTEIEEQFKDIIERLKQSKLKANKTFKAIERINYDFKK